MGRFRGGPGIDVLLLHPRIELLRQDVSRSMIDRCSEIDYEISFAACLAK
jgi:hypothetical protein